MPKPFLSRGFDTIIKARPYLIPTFAAIIFLILLNISNPGFVASDTSWQSAKIAQYRIIYMNPDEKQGGIGRFRLRYASWQNPHVLVQAERACVLRVSAIRPGAAPENMYRSDKNCDPTAMVNLRSHLREGEDALTLEIELGTIKAHRSMLFISPVLLGTHALSTMACIGLGLSLAWLAWLAALRCGLERKSALLLVAAGGYFACWLVLYSHFSYSNDLYAHLMAINHMAEFHKHLDDNLGISFHPDGYYILAAVVYKLAMSGGAIHPMLALRLFSLALFFGYCLLGLLLMQALLSSRSRAYYLGQACFLLWPVHIQLATRINNDIPLYTIWGLALYALARWQQGRQPHWLAIALAACGAGFLFKSNIAVALLIACVFMACGKAWRDGLRHAPRTVVFVCGGLLLTGLFINYHTNTTFIKDLFLTVKTGGVMEKRGPEYPFIQPNQARYFLTFHPGEFFAMPFATTYYSSDYWSFLLKTSLYGERKWHYYTLARVMNGSLLALIGTYGVLLSGMAWQRRAQARLWLPYVAAAGLPVLASATYARMYSVFFVTQDFRYIVPMLPPLALGFVWAADNAHGRAARVLAGAMIFSAVALALCGMMMYLGQAAYLLEHQGIASL